MDRQQLLFLARLTSVNTALGRYIARLMDEAAGHAITTYSVPLADVETELGEELTQLGRALAAKGAGPLPRIAGGKALELPPGPTEANGST
jgi:hypothetical protein